MNAANRDANVLPFRFSIWPRIPSESSRHDPRKQGSLLRRQEHTLLVVLHISSLVTPHPSQPWQASGSPKRCVFTFTIAITGELILKYSSM